MIQVHTINGEIFFINPDLIETMRVTPDTVLFLMNGKRILIKDDPQDVIDRIVAFRKRIFAQQFHPEKAEDVMQIDSFK